MTDDEEPAFRLWELWLLGTLLALAAGLTALAIAAGALATPATFFWFAVGLSSLWWISNLTLMPQPSVAVTKRT